ncbi:MAG: hypothetical protein ACOVMG_07230 [Flavobacterium sp.]
MENQSSLSRVTPLKVVALTSLTFIMFAVGIYFQNGVFLMPLALFKPALFFVVVISLIPRIKSIRLAEITLLIWTFLVAISSQFVLQFFYSEQEFETKSESILDFQNLILLAAIVVLFGWQIWCSFQLKGLMRILNLINAIAFTTCLLTGLTEWLIVPLIMWVVTFNSLFFKQTVHYAIAIFLLFIVASIVLTAMYYGSKPVILAL